MSTITPLLTLTTDFGHGDFHLGRLKGHLLSAAPGLRVVDISHDIPNYDIVRAAFIFRKAWQHFAPGTIHLISVNDYYQPRGRFLAARHNGHYFIGPDNGIFSLIFQKMPAETYILDRAIKKPSLAAAYAAAVAHIAQDRPFHEIGLPATQINERLAFHPVIGPNYIRGTVSYIDKFENATTNISRDLFEQVGRGRAFELLIKRNEPIDGLSFRYHDVPEGETLIRFDSDGLLEIAINLGKAASLLGIEVEDTVQVEFKQKGLKS
ncbi:MAG: SAM-dependent chlorinase/fluorinase [Bacteroidota bacterium]